MKFVYYVLIILCICFWSSLSIKASEDLISKLQSYPPFVLTRVIMTNDSTAILTMHDRYLESLYKVTDKFEYILITHSSQNYKPENFHVFIGQPESMVRQEIKGIKFCGDGSTDIEIKGKGLYHLTCLNSLNNMSFLKTTEGKYNLDEVINLNKNENNPTQEELKILALVGELFLY